MQDFYDEDYYGYDKEHEGVFEEEIDMQLKGFHGLKLQANSVEHFPFLSPYLKHTQIDKNSFFKFVFDNFNQLNTNELQAINENFLTQEYVNIMFDYVIENKVVIDYDTYKTYLYNKATNPLVEHFQQQLSTYYAIKHAHKIPDSEWKILFEHVYNFEDKHLFKNITFEGKEPIFSKTFFKYFSENDQIITSYMQCVVQNNWSENIDFLCRNFSSIVKYYLYDSKHSINQDNTLLEQNYIYHYPSDCTTTKLSYDKLQDVFSKIYQDLPDIDLTSESNFQFLQNLYTGIYYLFDYIAQKEPEKLTNYFEKKPYVISQLLNDLQKKSENVLPPAFIYTFFNNVFMPNVDLVFTQSDTVKKIIISNAENKTTHFLNKNIELFSEKEKQYLIFNTLKSNIPVFPGLDSNKLIVSLQKFSLTSLEIFNQNIDLFLDIIKDTVNSRDDFPEVKECVNKLIINKKLQEKFSLDTPNKVKQRKI